MDPRSLLKGLHPLEIKVLLRYTPGEPLETARLIADLGYVEGHANQAQAWLIAKGLAAETGRSAKAVFELTPLGRSWLEAGTPEERIIGYLTGAGPTTMPAMCEALGMEQKDAGSAFGRLSREGVLSMGADKLVTLVDAKRSVRAAALHSLLAKAAAVDSGILEAGSLDAAETALMAEVAKKREIGRASCRERV